MENSNSVDWWKEFDRYAEAAEISPKCPKALEIALHARQAGLSPSGAALAIALNKQGNEECQT